MKRWSIEECQQESSVPGQETAPSVEELTRVCSLFGQTKLTVFTAIGPRRYTSCKHVARSGKPGRAAMPVVCEQECHLDKRVWGDLALLEEPLRTR